MPRIGGGGGGVGPPIIMPGVNGGGGGIPQFIGGVGGGGAEIGIVYESISKTESVAVQLIISIKICVRHQSSPI